MSRRILILIAALAVPLSLVTGVTVQSASAQAGSTAVITPASGPPGSTVNASGANWTPGDHIQAEWGDNNSNLGSPVVVASNGTFKDSFAIPSSAALGSHQVLFWDQEGRFFEVANFDVASGSPSSPPSSCSAPSVSLTPAAGPVGSKFTMAGAGWAPGGEVHVTLPYGSKGIFGTSNATPTVGAGGSWQTSVTAGKSPAGSYTFTFAESGCPSKNGTFKVTGNSPAPLPCPPRPQPVIYWSQVAGPQGVSFYVSGSGWYAKDTVTAQLPYQGSFSVSKTSWPADRSGDWKLNISVGDQTPPGSYQLVFSQSACGGLHLTGTFKVTVTRIQLGDLVSAISGLVPAADKVGQLTGGQRWSTSIVGKAVALIGKAQTIISIGISGLDVVPVHNDLNALIRDLKKAHNNKKDPTVQKDLKRLEADTNRLRSDLLAIVPGLDLVFPPSVS